MRNLCSIYGNLCKTKIPMNNSGLSSAVCGPHEFFSQRGEEVCVFALHYLCRVGCPVQTQGDALGQRLRASVDCHEEIVASAGYNQFNGGRVRDDDGAYVECVRGHGRHEHHARERGYYRPAVGKRVGRAARRCRDNESVGLVCGQMLAIDAGTDGNHRCRVALQDGHVVEGTVIALDMLAVGAYLYKSAVLHAVVATVEGIDAAFHIVGPNIGKKAHTAHVHAYDGHLPRAHTTGGLKQCAVTAKGECEVAGWQFGEGLQLMIPVCSKRAVGQLKQELTVVAVYGHLRPMTPEGGKNTVYGCRFLLLVDVAEDGISLGLSVHGGSPSCKRVVLRVFWWCHLPLQERVVFLWVETFWENVPQHELALLGIPVAGHLQVVEELGV